MHSYWEKTAYFSHSDFVIIGGGFTGLWTAIELKKKFPNKSIKVIDQHKLPQGASTKNAGFSCFGSPTELIHDAEKYGRQSMWSTAFKRYEGIRKIHNTFAYHKINYQNTGGFECLSTNDLENVSQNINWLNEDFFNLTGNKNCFEFETKMHGLTGFDALVKNKLEGALHPAKLHQQLISLNVELGVELLFGYKVAEIETSTTGVSLILDDVCIKAEHAILCTNAFSNQLAKSIQVVPQRGQVFVTNIIENLQLNGCYHFDEGFYYFRNVENRILIGGARNKDFEAEQTDKFANTESIKNEIYHFVKNHITKTDIHFEYEWSGIMGFSNNKEPIVQQLNDRLFCGVGLNGMGVALAPIIAEEIAALIL